MFKEKVHVRVFFLMLTVLLGLLLCGQVIIVAPHLLTVSWMR